MAQLTASTPHKVSAMLPPLVTSRWTDQAYLRASHPDTQVEVSLTLPAGSDGIGFLDGTGTDRIGVDINDDFINHCRTNYVSDGLEFHVADAMKLGEWWVKMGYDKKYKSPLMVCPNNTIMIMPEEIRDTVIEEMRVVAGIEGRIVITYWNGRMFAHGVMGYYRKNSVRGRRPSLVSTIWFRKLNHLLWHWSGSLWNLRSH